MSPLNIALSVLIHNSLMADCVGNPNILQPHSGGIMVGKTNMDQFASGLVGTRTPYGVARNPLMSASSQAAPPQALHQLWATA